MRVHTSIAFSNLEQKFLDSQLICLIKLRVGVSWFQKFFVCSRLDLKFHYPQIFCLFKIGTNFSRLPIFFSFFILQLTFLYPWIFYLFNIETHVSVFPSFSPVQYWNLRCFFKVALETQNVSVFPHRYLLPLLISLGLINYE